MMGSTLGVAEGDDLLSQGEDDDTDLHSTEGAELVGLLEEADLVVVFVPHARLLCYGVLLVL